MHFRCPSIIEFRDVAVKAEVGDYHVQLQFWLMGRRPDFYRSHFALTHQFNVLDWKQVNTQGSGPYLRDCFHQMTKSLLYF